MQAPNIRSGWKCIFFVLSLAAGDHSAPFGTAHTAAGLGLGRVYVMPAVVA
jgi:hypothetical protein